MVLVAPSRREDASFVEDSHSKKYFEAIHNCLDGMMAEIDRSSIGTQIAAQLITIVNSLLYTHLVKVLSESEIGQDFAEIEALQLAVKTEESLGRSDALRGTYLMILTRRNMLLVTAAVAEVGRPEESRKVDEEIEEKEEEREEKEEKEEREEKEEKEEKEEREIKNVNETKDVEETKDVDENENEMNIKKEKTVDHQTNSENDIENENTLSESTTSEEHRSKNTENESLESPEEKDPTDSSEITTEATSEIDNQDPTDPSDTNKATSPFMESTDIIPSQQSISLEEEEEGEMDAEEDSLDVDEQREMEIVSRIVESLERFGSCSVDEAKEIDWNHCESYVVKGVIPLQEVQNVNILVSEENGDSTATSPQIIHIRYGSNGEIYLQVDYAIFVVNEIMNRIGTFLSCVCFICSVVCVC